MEEYWFPTAPDPLSLDQVPMSSITTEEFHSKQRKSDKTSSIISRLEAGDDVPIQLSSENLLSRLETGVYQHVILVSLQVRVL